MIAQYPAAHVPPQALDRNDHRSGSLKDYTLSFITAPLSFETPNGPVAVARYLRVPLGGEHERHGANKLSQVAGFEYVEVR